MILGGVEGLFVRTSSLEVGGEDVFIRTGLLEVVVEVSLQKSAECSLSYKLVVVSLSSGQIPDFWQIQSRYTRTSVEKSVKFLLSLKHGVHCPPLSADVLRP